MVDPLAAVAAPRSLLARRISAAAGNSRSVAT